MNYVQPTGVCTLEWRLSHRQGHPLHWPSVLNGEVTPISMTNFFTLLKYSNNLGLFGCDLNEMAAVLS